jgi:hypothetical protein
MSDKIIAFNNNWTVKYRILIESRDVRAIFQKIDDNNLNCSKCMKRQSEEEIHVGSMRSVATRGIQFKVESDIHAHDAPESIHDFVNEILRIGIETETDILKSDLVLKIEMSNRFQDLFITGLS